MIYKTLFNIKKMPADFRDALAGDALKELQLFEYQASKWLDGFVRDCADYHVPYQQLKKKCEEMVAVTGGYDLGVAA